MLNILDQEQLRELEARCIQEQPPAAMAACPLRVECRTLAMAVKDGHFDAARALYTKTVPLPYALSALCKMPCTEACLRKDLGGAIQMRELEWAAMEYGNATPRRIFPQKKSGQAAVIGSGPFGLTAASVLAKKGFNTTVFEREAAPGGGLLRSGLTAERLAKDLALVREAGVVFQQQHIVDPASLLASYDAVVLATGEVNAGDPLTLATTTPGMFAGGRFTSLVEAIAAGKRVATSVERYVKNVSLTAGREHDLDRTTNLFVETSYFTDSTPTITHEPTREAASDEAKRCLDCQCMECAKGCAFISEFKRYPKLYLREIYNNLSITQGNHTSNTLINACAICSQCEAICPHGLDLGAAIHSARSIMVATKKMPVSAFEFAVDDMLQANGETSFFYRHQPGHEASRYLFFPGCQLGASAPQTVQNTYAHLCQSLDGGVAFMHGCCGIMADWAGQTALFETTKARLVDAWNQLGRPIVITSCATCQKTFNGLFDEVTAIWDVLLETGLPATSGATAMTIHDACGARDLAKARGAVRQIAGQLGIDIHEPTYTGDRSPCCGYGGLVQFSNPAMANKMTAFCIDDVDETRLTYCMGCRDRFTKAGARAVHLLELMFPGDDLARAAPGYSLRQDNRARLKQRMLRAWWHEEQETIVKLHLRYDKDLAELLDERLILEDDIRAVIEHALATGQFIEVTSSGLRIAHKKIGHVTYWVYFAPEGDGWLVRRAYSHRMEIRE